MLISCKHRVNGIRLVLQVYCHEPKYWTNQEFEQVMALDEKSGNQSKYILSSGDHECLYSISQQTIKQLWRCFSPEERRSPANIGQTKSEWCWDILTFNTCHVQEWSWMLKCLDHGSMKVHHLRSPLGHRMLLYFCFVQRQMSFSSCFVAM